MTTAQKVSKALATPIPFPKQLLMATRVIMCSLLAVLLWTQLQKALSKQAIWNLDNEKAAAHKVLDKTESFGRAVMDPQGKIVSWNKGMTDLFGWTSAEMRGNTLARLRPNHSEEGSASFDVLSEFSQYPLLSEQIYDLKMKDGSTEPFRVSIADATIDNQIKFRYLRVDRLGAVSFGPRISEAIQAAKDNSSP